MFSPELPWMLVSFVLTLLVFSYIFGDNPVFRFTLSILIGTTAGYFAVILLQKVIAPGLIQPLLSGSYALAAIPIILSLLLLLRLIPRYTRLSNIPIGYLAGVGGAVVIGGAVFGTLVRQVQASIYQFPAWRTLAGGESWIPFLEGVFILFGTITSLLYFQFTVRSKKDGVVSPSSKPSPMRAAGEYFIIVTLAAMFAGVFSASITALVSRIAFLWETIRYLIG